MAKIKSPKLLYHFMNAWRAWHRNLQVAQMLYRGLIQLLRPEDPFREYNLKMMTEADCIDILLRALRESLVQPDDNVPPLDHDTIVLIVNLMSLLIKHPPGLSVINEIMEFLLLLHPAAESYVRNFNASTFLYPLKTSGDNFINFGPIDDEPIPIAAIESLSIDGSTRGKETNLAENVNLVIAMLANMLASITKILPRNIMMDALNNEVIRLDMLIILLNNPSDLVRVEVLKLLFSWVRIGQTFGSSVLERFHTRTKGFYLMAHQLSRFKTTIRMLELCYGIILEIDDFDKATLCLEFDVDTNADDQLKLSAWTIFLTLITKCEQSSDIILSLQFLNAYITKAINRHRKIIHYLIENGLVNSVMKIFFDSMKNYIIQHEQKKADTDSDDEVIEIESISQVQLLHEIDNSLELLVRYYFKMHNPQQSLDEYTKLVYFLDLMNDYVPVKFCYLIRDRQIVLMREALRQFDDYKNHTIKIHIPKLWSDVIGGMFSNDKDHSPIRDHYRSNLGECINVIVKIAVEFIISRDIGMFTSSIEKQFTMDVLELLLSLLSTCSLSFQSPEATSAISRTMWFKILTTIKNQLGKSLWKLIIYLMSPSESMTIDEHNYFTSKILQLDLDLVVQVLNYCNDPCYNSILLTFIYDILDSNAEKQTFDDDHDVDCDDDDDDDDDDNDEFRQEINHKLSKLAQELTETILTINNGRHQSSDRLNRDKWSSILAICIDKRKQKLGQLSVKLQNELQKSLVPLTQAAALVTQNVNVVKDKERKHYMHELKQNKALNYFIMQQWQSLIVAQTHERALWYSPAYYFQSWELDPTEGPDRIRRRLRPCHLKLAQRYFRRDRSSISQQQCHGPHPLCSMFEGQERLMDSNALKSRLYTDERITFNCECKIVTRSHVFDGEILIGSSCIYFIGQENESPVVVTKDFWFDEIRELCSRRYQLQDVGLELFLTNNLTYLLAFYNLKDRDDFYQQLKQRQMPSLTHYDQLVDLDRLTALWRERKITNFKYLTYLNKLSGRSFNDLMQYPVFPFILADYKSEVLNLLQADTFRKLAAPIAVQTKDREHYFRDHYEYLKSEHDSTMAQYSSPADINCLAKALKPYHYSSHYSNSATVLHFLVRLPPYTQMLIQYQDGNFDLPDRTFHSMATTWQLSSKDSTSDFKELLPEFFFLPEMFCNIEQFDLGQRQNKEYVNDVVLPPWCRNSDPRLFTLIHRQALESNHVSDHLHEWIDLIFGYKQTGQAAVDALNVFHPATYYGMINFSNKTNTPSQSHNSLVEDQDGRRTKGAAICDDSELNKVALQTMIRTFGQMPKQLFVTAHRQRQAGSIPEVTSYNEQLGGTIQSRSSRSTNVLSSSSVGFNNMRTPKQVLGEVIGIRWGSYVGSPSESDPIAIRQDKLSNSFGIKLKLTLSPSGDLAVLKQNSSLILNQTIKHSWRGAKATAFTTKSVSSSPLVKARQQHYYKDSSSMLLGTNSHHKFSCNNMSLITWSFLDGIIRIKHPAIGEKSSDPLLWADYIIDSITTCQSSVELNLLIVGYKSGALCVHLITSSDGAITHSNPILAINADVVSRWLYCHTGPITSIAINKSFGVIVTASQDGTCVIWDLNNLTYIRTIHHNNNKRSIELLTVSDTLGDIISISSNQQGISNGENASLPASILYAHTINGVFVNSLRCRDKATAVCCSSAPEGISVNVIVVGFQDGTIRLYSSWDLTKVKDIRISGYTLPITSIIYSKDNQYLFVVNDDNDLITLRNQKKSSSGIPRIMLI